MSDPPGGGTGLRRVGHKGAAALAEGNTVASFERAVEVGIETARDLVAAGNKALLTGEMGIANTTASAALIAACTGVDAAEVTGRGTGINDETHARKIEVVRRALELHQPDAADPFGMLAAFGGLEHAAMVGLILGAASLRTPVILDGVSAGAAALVARAHVNPARLVLGGRSMGGRIGSMAVAEGLPSAGLILISYPLHPPGKPETLRTAHLPALEVPCLFISGTKDPFGTPAELEAATATIPGPVHHVWVEGKGHDLKGANALIASTAAEWLRGLKSGRRA